MKISEKFKDQFESGIISRGSEYYRRNKVVLKKYEKDTLKTIVRGTKPYNVDIWLTSGHKSMDAFCPCPHFSNGHLCKHLWASLLLVDDLEEHKESEYVTLPDGEGVFKEDWMEVIDIIKTQYKSEIKTKKNYQVSYEIFYINALDKKSITVEVKLAEKKANGDWAKPKSKKIDHETLMSIESKEDQDILNQLLGVEMESDNFYYRPHPTKKTNFIITPKTDPKVLKGLCTTGRTSFKSFDGVLIKSLEWDEGKPWEFQLNIEEEEEFYFITGFFKRDSIQLNLSHIHVHLENGLLVWGDQMGLADYKGLLHWLDILINEQEIKVPKSGQSKLVELIYTMPKSIQLSLPESLMMETQEIPLTKKIALHKNVYERGPNATLIASINFLYGSHPVTPGKGSERIPLVDEKKSIVRDLKEELHALSYLKSIGFKDAPEYLREKADYIILTSQFNKALSQLTKTSWEVEAESAKYVHSDKESLHVSSGVDWFELHGELQFGEVSSNLSDVFEALKKGSEYVKLGNGQYGILPSQWLKDMAPMIKMGELNHDHIHFKRNQTALLDALLSGLPNTDIDKNFRKYRDKLLTIGDIKKTEAPKKFVGTLREYQKEGLGWLLFLKEIGLGGCLADDMGLGKTVQVLAMLKSLKPSDNPEKKPSLIVVPRSLMFNWREEVNKFTPNVKVLEYSGADRAKLLTKSLKNTLVLTTYGTMRKDILKLKDQEFNYVILDEAQAIKNPNSLVAKATRLLPAQHRLALSGTPVENNLNDIWSIFEFLNPGMLGKFKAFGKMEEEASREFLRKALGPFILRRRKSEVAQGLPEKTEQTLYCEMTTSQKKFYSELKNYYQAGLLKKVHAEGMGKVKIQVLEALLRLRQAACHPGLVDKSMLTTSSSKIESLYEQLQEVMAEGHKALVFSQFTSLLSIFKEKLDREGVSYLYLDGKTRKREQCVNQFQKDPTKKVFLISLKAGGVGLNLTAAEYVFILDPWWNPAVEAQAIDRAHRIGQNNKVFAYRMICKGTVEEKIIELQKEKKELAESIISKDKGGIQKLTPDDLDFLLS